LKKRLISLENQLFSYLNTQYVRKNTCNDADIQFGTAVFDAIDNLLDIGEVIKQQLLFSCSKKRKITKTFFF
jgi:hypothetical protein